MKKEIGVSSQEIVERLQDGERISIDWIIKTHYHDEEPWRAEKRARSLLASARKILGRDGLVIAPLGNRTCGIPRTKAEVAYAQAFYSCMIRRYTELSLQLHEFAKRKNLVPEGFKRKTFGVPVLSA